MKKKRFLLAIIMLMVCVVCKAQMGVGTTFTIDGITYSVNENTNTKRTVKVIGCSQTGDVTIPATVRSVQPENLEWEVFSVFPSFENGSQIESLTLSNGIKRVGFYELNALSNLKVLNIPASVDSIVTTDATNIFKSLTTLNIDENNNKYSSSGLVLYNKNKTAILHYVISNEGETFEIPNTVTTIGRHAFAGGNKLTKIVIPQSVNKIEANIWGDELVEFDVDDNNTYFCDADNGILFSKDKSVLVACPRRRDFSITENGHYTIPQEVSIILERAFVNNATLKSVSFANPDVHIVNKAFYACYNIDYIKLPDNGEVETGAFSFGYIKTVNIGKRSEFSADMFVTQTKISSIEVDPENEYYEADLGVLYTKDREEVDKTLVFCPRNYGADHPKEYTIKEGTKIVGAYAFEGGCGLDKIKLASSVETLEVCSLANANEVEFAENGNLSLIKNSALRQISQTSIELPNTVVELQPSAFYASKLTSVTLNEGLQTIGYWAFGYTHIEELEIPSTVTSLGALFHMPDLKKVTFKEGSQLTTINSIFGDTPNVEEVVFKEGSILDRVNVSAFANMHKLTKVVLPETVTKLDSKAFFQCENLESVTFREPSQLTKIGSNTFQSCGFDSFTVPSGVQTIDNAAFYDCNKLETIEIPAATKTISNTAFQLCSGLKEINVSHDNANLSSSDGILLNKAKTELKIFPAGKTQEHFALLPPSITKIGDYSFYFNKSMKNVCIPNKVEEIGIRAFAECTNLETITFLCDNKIPVEKIVYSDDATVQLNTGSFALTPTENVTIYVRKALLDEYMDDEFYTSNFKEIKPSFFVGEEDGEHEEYIPVDNENVDLLDVRSGVHSYVIPKTASTNAYGEDKTYKVALIGDYAFQNTPSTMKEVITFENVEYIGAKAFKQTNTTPSIENIIFVQKEPQAQLLSTYRFELNAEDLPSSYTEAQKKQYMEIADNQHVYVRKSDNTACKTQWPKYASQIDYKIPGIKIGTKFGTFSREFDVDLLDYKAEDQEDSDVIINWDGSKNRAKVIAFTGFLEQVNPYDNYTYIRMRSINCETESEVSTKPGDGTYIPANTGVLLRAYTEDAKTPEGFYYRIGEDDGVNFHPLAENENVMVEVVVDKKLIQPKEGDYTNYIISGGQYHAISAAGTLAVHKSYMHVFEPEGSNGARVIFGSDEEATGIEEINAALNAEDDAVIYNLNGQRVNGSAKGIVIKNGKKTFVR